MQPLRPPLASQARASARFSSLTTATTSTSMTDGSSYWASSQPKRYKYRSYTSSDGNDVMASPGTDMTSPGTSNEHKFGSGDEKGFPGLQQRVGLTPESEGQSTMHEPGSVKATAASDGSSASLDKMLDEEIDRLSSVSSASPRPVSLDSNIPSLTSANSSSDEPSSTSSPFRRRPSSISPSGNSRRPSTVTSPATSRSSYRQPRPSRRLTHTLYPNLSPTSEDSHEEVGVVSFASRKKWDEGLSTIREERKNSLSILEGHGRIPSSGTTSGYGGSRIVSRDLEKDSAGMRQPAESLQRSAKSLLPSPTISRMPSLTPNTPTIKPLNLRSSPALRDRINLFEGRTGADPTIASSQRSPTVSPARRSEAPSTPRSGYFSKRDVQPLLAQKPIAQVDDLFSPRPSSRLSTKRAAGGESGEAAVVLGHSRIPAEGAGSPWFSSGVSAIETEGGRSATEIGGAPWPVLPTGAQGMSGLGLLSEGGTCTDPALGKAVASLVGQEARASPSLSKRISLTRTPTRTRNLVDRYALDLGEGPSTRSSTTVASTSNRQSPTDPTTPTRDSRASTYRGQSSTVRRKSPARVGTGLNDERTLLADTSPAVAYSRQYLQSKPLPPIAGPSRLGTAYDSPLRAAADSTIYGIGSMGGQAEHSGAYSIPFLRSLTITPTQPTLLSNSFGPSANGSIMIPEAPSRWAGNASTVFPSKSGRSPLSKSPLRDLIGALVNVKDKVKHVGRNRANTLDRSVNGQLHTSASGPSTYSPHRGTIGVGVPEHAEREVTAAFGRTATVMVPVSDVGYASELGRSKPLPISSVEGAVRVSGAVYLQCTPCSSLSPWGDWESARASLTPSNIVFDAAGERHTMDLARCAEVRSLRREEARRKGLPSIDIPQASEPQSWYQDPDRVEILELTFEDGTRCYFGVEGISGRLGWVTALWDAILACRTGPTACPPRSPTVSSRIVSARYVSPSTVAAPAISQITTLGHSVYPPATSVANQEALLPLRSDLRQADTSAPCPPEVRPGFYQADALSDSVKAMFEIAPNGSPLRTPGNVAWTLAPESRTQQGSAEEEWIPAARQLSVFGVVEREPAQLHFAPVSETYTGPQDIDTSFDEADLNPSRSASQRKPRSPTILSPNPVAKLSADPAPVDLAPSHSPTIIVPLNATLDLPSTTAAPSRPLIQPLTTAQLLPWKRAPRNLTIPAPLAEPSPDKLPTSPAFPSPHQFNGDLDGVFPPPKAYLPFEDGDCVVRLKYSLPSTEVEVVPPEVPRADDGAQEARPDVAPAGSVLGESNQATGAVAVTNGTSEPDLVKLHDRVSILHNDFTQRLSSIHTTMSTAAAQEAGTRELRSVVDTLGGIGNDITEVRASMALTAAALAKTAEVPALSLDEVYAKLDAVLDMLKPAATPEVGGTLPTMAAMAEADNKPASQLGSKSNTATEVPASKEGKAGLPSSGEAPGPEREEPAPSPVGVNEEVTRRLSEVLEAIKTLQGARQTQDQQTTDMAGYLGQLNGWLEKFVLNGTSEIQAMAGNVDRLTRELAPVAPPRDPNAAQGTPDPVAPQGLPGIVREVHEMAVQQRQRAEGEAVVAQRVDALIAMLGEDRQRAAQQQQTFDSVLGVLERQRAEHELLLRALATDLTSEIRGEKVKFIEAMRDATSVNVNLHVEDFKKMLNQEVTKNMHELAGMREQKKALEMVISDLFAIKAKHTDAPPIARPAPAAAPPPASPPATPARAPPKSPAPSNLGPRALPKAPGH